MNVLPIGPHSPRPTKLVGLDLVRAAAALGVVLLHACVPYPRHPMPGLAWPVRDGASDVVGYGFWAIELFIMPLFLVMAGFFAYQTLCRHGERKLIKNRARRLLLPLLFGMVVILPLDLHVWVLGWVTDGLVEAKKLRSFKFSGDIDKDLWGLSHLWFLQYLFLYVVVLALCSRLCKKTRRFRLPHWSTLRWTGVLVAAGSIVLCFRPEVVWGFQHSFWPVASKWTYSGLFFAAGVLVAVRDPQLHWLTGAAHRLWAPTACASVAALVLGQWHLGGGENRLATVMLAVLTCASASLISAAIIGSAVRHVHRIPVSIQYIAAASFWVYIVHHPLMGLIHIDLRVLLPAVSPVVKTAIAFTVATGMSLLSYEAFARKSALGRWLGFAWQPPSSKDETILPIDRPEETVERRAA